MRAPYSFLTGTIRVIAVDRDKRMLDLYRKRFGLCCLFELQCATSVQDAEKRMRESGRFHVCLYGVSAGDGRTDEFSLLRSRGKSIAFLVISETSDPRLGYAAATYGAKGFLYRPEDLETEILLGTAQQAFLNNIVNPDSSYDRPFVRRATKALIEQAPRSVSEWAGQLSVSESYLRKAWTEAFGFQLKHVLFLYELYCCALAYYDVVYTLSDGNTTAVLSRAEYARHYEYWSSNKEALQKILS